MHAETHEFIHQCWNELPLDGAAVVEFGARDVNGRCSSVVAGRYASWVGVDPVDGPNVDVVADGATVDLGVLFDVAVCTSVFEHTEAWPDILANMVRHVRPGGTVLVSCPGLGFPPHSALYEGPVLEGEWYAGVGPHELAATAVTLPEPLEVLEAWTGGAWGCETFMVARRRP